MTSRISAVGLGKQIRTLFDVGALGAMPDRGLLDQFARGGATSEAAFSTLVERHGAMVLRVCRQVLADTHLADDAFQATFLLLARRARSIHDPDALAGWLHRVAWRVAVRARAGARRRIDRERHPSRDFAVSAGDPLERAELCAIVHEEINRLGDAQRLPILLCALEGLSHEEAAERLRWPVGTVKSRLVRGRRRLRGRLARRGLAPSIALTAAAGGMPAQATTVPLALAVATTRAALASANPIAATAGVAATPISQATAALIQKELGAIFATKVALAAGAAIAAGAVVLVVIALGAPLGPRVSKITPHRQSVRPPGEQPPMIAELKPTSAAMPAQTTNREPALALSEFRSQILGAENPKPPKPAPEKPLPAFGKQVARAITDGVRFLEAQQRADGSWADIDGESKTGATSLALLALVAAGEGPDSRAVGKALDHLRGHGPDDLKSTYAIALQTMAFAAAAPGREQVRIASNVSWLERAQIQPHDPFKWAGSWTYSDARRPRSGDNSNTQYALLGLHAASEAGVPVKPAVWELAHVYWEKSQNKNGGWAYTSESQNVTGSMTCAGLASLIISGRRPLPKQELLEGEFVRNCGNQRIDSNVQAGVDWLTGHFQVGQNFGNGQQWKFYYLYGLERVGRLTGLRFFGKKDWFREGALELVHEQDKVSGCWEGKFIEADKTLATSFALLFLAKGRAPVLINKLRHDPEGDWDNDPDDVQNIVNIVSRDWKSLLTWRSVDSRTATIPDLLRAPILFMNGHKAPELTESERAILRGYVEKGGFLFAEACCARVEFDNGFKKLMAELFPGLQEQLRPLADDHPLWRSRHLLKPATHALLGIRRDGRTAVVYSPGDLSCYWNQARRDPASPAVVKAIRVGQNVIDYATTRTLPPDKLSELID